MAQSQEAVSPSAFQGNVCISPGTLAPVQAFQHHYAWNEEDPALAAAGDMGMPMFCFETAIKVSVAQGAAVSHAGCTACQES